MALCHHLRLSSTTSNRQCASRSVSVLRASGRAVATHRRSSCVRRAAAAEDTDLKADTPIKFNHLLLTILDANEYLSDGSKQAVTTAALLAQKELGRVTVLVINEPGTEAQQPDKQIENISWHLRDRGVDKFEVLQRATTQPASVLIGDVADEVMADMVVIASEAVHAKHVDANQLAEFVACPLLVLP